MSDQPVDYTALEGDELRAFALDVYGLKASNMNDKTIKVKIKRIIERLEYTALEIQDAEDKTQSFIDVHDPRLLGKVDTGEKGDAGMEFKKKTKKVDKTKYVAAGAVRNMDRVQINISETSDPVGTLPVKCGVNGLFMLIPRGVWVEVPKPFVDALTVKVPVQVPSKEVDARSGKIMQKIREVPRYPLQVLPLGMEPVSVS